METVLLYALGVLILLVGLMLSIGLHEVGHLVPAKKFGVKVGQYMIGFGPTLWSKRFGETEYGVKAIPLGGYISMAGMFPPAKPGGRARTASTGFFDTVMQEADAPARRGSTMIAEAREASLDGLEDGHHRAFYKLATWKRIIIMLGGPAMNLLLAILFFGIVYSGFGVPQVSTTVGSVSACVLPITSERQECLDTDPAAPGAAAGLLPGDEIVEVDGVAVADWTEATEIIRAHPDQTISFVVLRGSAETELSVTPILTERYTFDDAGEVVLDASGDPVLEPVGFVGISPAYERVTEPVTAVIPAVWDRAVAVGEVIITLPGRLYELAVSTFSGTERDPNGPVGIVGVGRIAGEIASLDTIPVVDRAAGMIELLGGLNLALFLFNLIPLMPLDGGHVAGAIVESIRRGFAKLFGRPDPGPVDTAKLIPVTLTITTVLALMSVFLIFADIVNPVSIL